MSRCEGSGGRGEARAPGGAEHVQPGTVARSLLSQALDEADPDARNVALLLDGIPDAYERAQLGLQQARGAQTVSLDEL